jgi:hypothetical protein
MVRRSGSAVTGAVFALPDIASVPGDDWTASQWNYDEAPGAAAGAWTSDGSC